MKRVLFVCLGNICRSPVARGVAQQYLDEHDLNHRVAVDSCGTSSYHEGEQANAHTRRTAKRFGVDLEAHRSRRLRDSDFEEFDWLVALDGSNERDIRRRLPADAPCAVVRFMDYVPDARTRDVPDPYYEGGFEGVHRLIESGIPSLMDAVLKKDHSFLE